MIRFRSYRTRLQTAFLLLGLAALGITGWQASEYAARALRTATYERLTAIRETRARQIERYFLDLGNHVLALSSDEATVTALEQFAATERTLQGGDPREIQKHYDKVFRDLRAKEPDAGERIREWFPEDPVTLALQHWFIAQNPYPERFHLLTAPGAERYSSIHSRYHPTLHRYMSAFGFYDIFLISPDTGRLLYTVMKEVDLGTTLADHPYSRTTLASAWRRAMALPEPETFVVEDYAPYLPSSFAPAAFVAAPVYRAGTKVGVLAIQLSIDGVNGIMTGDGRWKEEGLGESGQAYLIGNDGTLRSDVRHEIESPEEFYRELQEAGTPAQAIDRIRRHGTAVLNLKVTPDRPVQYTGIATDFRGVQILRSEAPLSLAGLQWMVVAEIEAAEALGPITELRWRTFWQSLVLAALLGIAAHYLSTTVTKPLLNLATSARRLGRGDFGVRLPVESADEVGQLADSFNRMAEDLEHTTVSRQELDRLLNSLINGVFVISAAPNASVDDVLDSPVREFNRAGRELLHIKGSEIRFRDLLPPENAAEWRERMARAVGEGRVVSAEEATLVAQDGARVPVLFSASWLSHEHGRSPGLVCVAQDIAEWKAAQDNLRRMSKVFMDATDPIVVADSAGRIADCNAEAEQTYRWSRSDLVGRNLHDLFVRHQEISDLLIRCLAGDPIRNVETTQRDHSGRRFPALLTLSLLTGESPAVAGVAAISKDITERKSAEQAIRQKQAELEILTGRLIAAQEDERRRLARELHDDLTQRLAAIAIEAGRLERITPGDDDRWRVMLDRIKRQMGEIAEEVHGLSRRLHPSTLDDLGLVAAIESECRAWFERTGTPVALAADDSLPPLSRETSLGLYRIVQEALRNASKHSAAEEVRVLLHRRNGSLHLEIADDGRGFERGAPNWRAGIGLASMEERARLLGGTFSVHSAPGRGTRIEVTVPVGGSDEEAQNSAG